KIASGETSYNSVVSALYTQLAQELSTASKLTAINAIPCPKCKSQLKKFKNTKTNQFFWICSNEDCKHSMNDDKGKPVEKVIHSCPKCKTCRLNKFQYSQTKDFFWICNDQECKHSMDDKKGQPVEKIKYPCPKCSTPLFRSKKEGKDPIWLDRKSTRLNSSHVKISYAVFCLKKKKQQFNSHNNRLESN